MKLAVEILDGAVQVVAAPPARVSQHTAEPHLGIPKRRFLALVAEFKTAGGDVLSVGRLRLVEPSAFVDWLRHRDALAARDEDDDDLDGLLGAAGLVVAREAAE